MINIMLMEFFLISNNINSNKNDEFHELQETVNRHTKANAIIKL